MAENRKKRKTINDTFLAKRMDPSGHTSTTLQKVALLAKKIDKPLDEASGESSGTPYGVPIDQSVPTPNGTPYGTPYGIPNENLVCLNENQFILYHSLKNLGEKITTLSLITRETGIPVNTLKANLKKLRKFNIIADKGRQHAGGGKFGFIGKIINKKIALTGDQNRVSKIVNGINYDNLLLQNPTVLHPKVHPKVHPIYSSSSISINNNTTTTKEIESILNSPELGYWRQKGLTVKQIELWLESAQCSLENMAQYLCYCRYQMVDLNLEESKPVKNVFDWFFRLIEKTGGYPKPKGYKSFREKQLETEREIVAKREKETKELKELFDRKKKAEEDIRFWAMMNDPEGEAYKTTLAKLSPFERKLKSGQAFEATMQGAFEKMENCGL